MSGYRNCKSCGRRFLAGDDSEYCSPSCFSLESTSDERRMSRLWFALPVVSVLLLVFFLFEELDLNYFFLQNVSFLKGHATTVFDEAGPRGVLFLHEKLVSASDDELEPLLDGLAGCKELADYQWRIKLVKELDDWYDEADPALQRAIIRVFGRAKMVPAKRQFAKELLDRETSDDIMTMFEQVLAPHFVAPLALLLKDPDVTAAQASRALGILKNMEERHLENARLVAWVAEHSADATTRREAVMTLPAILWPSEMKSHGLDGSDNFVESFKALQRIVSSSDDEGLRTVARQAIEMGRKKRQAFVEFDALKVFDEVFE